MVYDNIRSDFVKNKIKECGWKRRSYIEGLLYFEKWVTGEVTGKLGFGRGFQVDFFEDKYPKEFKAIYSELNQKEYAKYLLNKKKEKKQKRQEAEKDRKDEKKQEQELKAEWKKAGGKI